MTAVLPATGALASLCPPWHTRGRLLGLALAAAA